MLARDSVRVQRWPVAVMHDRVLTPAVLFVILLLCGRVPLNFYLPSIYWLLVYNWLLFTRLNFRWSRKFSQIKFWDWWIWLFSLLFPINTRSCCTPIPSNTCHRECILRILTTEHLWTEVHDVLAHIHYTVVRGDQPLRRIIRKWVIILGYWRWRQWNLVLHLAGRAVSWFSILNGF